MIYYYTFCICESCSKQDKSQEVNKFIEGVYIDKHFDGDEILILANYNCIGHKGECESMDKLAIPATVIYRGPEDTKDKFMQVAMTQTEINPNKVILKVDIANVKKDVETTVGLVSFDEQTHKDILALGTFAFM